MIAPPEVASLPVSIPPEISAEAPWWTSTAPPYSALLPVMVTFAKTAVPPACEISTAPP